MPKEGSPALQLGFVNFLMNDFGVTSRKLRAMARTPEAAQMRGRETLSEFLSEGLRRAGFFFKIGTCCPSLDGGNNQPEAEQGAGTRDAVASPLSGRNGVLIPS